MLDNDRREDMNLEAFSMTLGDPEPQRHLLAAQPRDIEKALSMGNK